MSLHGALDLSNYTTNVPVPGSGTSGGLITDQHCRDWKSAGYTHAIVGTQWPVVADHQLEVCIRNGMSVDMYHWWYPDRDMTAYLAQRKFLSDKYPTQRNWLDCEAATPGLSASQVVADIDRCLQLIDKWKYEDLDSGIYTAAWWWPNATANSSFFSGRPLWHAAYPAGQLNLDQAKARWSPPITYGGWTKPAMWQFLGSTQQWNSNLDLNVFEAIDTSTTPPAPQVYPWRIVQEGFFLVHYYGNLAVYRIGSTDGQHQGRVSRKRGDRWYWDRVDAQGRFYQSEEEGD